MVINGHVKLNSSLQGYMSRRKVLLMESSHASSNCSRLANVMLNARCQMFPAFSYFYHNSIEDFPNIISPLVQLTVRIDHLHGDLESTKTFDNSKQAFTCNCISTHVDPTMPFIFIKANAFDSACKSVQSTLLRVIQGYSRPINHKYGIALINHFWMVMAMAHNLRFHHT